MQGKNPRVLVVDDEPDIRESIEIQFEMVGWETETAGSIENAKSQLDESNFDIVLSDVRMPGGTGVDLLNYLKQKRSETQVILMSAFSDITEETVRKMGAVGFLNKPFESSELISLVRKILRIS